MANMFNEDGTYNKTEWKAGDKITAVKLNKIELSLEAINNNDIDRHVEADSRLDILEERMTNTPDNEQMDALTEEIDILNTKYINILKYSNLAIDDDWTNAIQTAIDKSPSGSTILFPVGVYNHKGIHITRSINILGVGKYNSRLVNTGDGDSITIKPNIERGTIRDIGIFGNGIGVTASGATAKKGIVFMNNAVCWELNNVWMRGHSDYFLYACGTGNVNNIYINHCQFEWGGGGCIRFYQESFSNQINAVHINDTNISSFQGNGIELWGQSLSVTNCAIQACKQYGIALDGGSQNNSSSHLLGSYICNNYFELCYEGFIYIDSENTPYSRYINGLSIINNYGSYSVRSEDEFDCSDVYLVEINNKEYANDHNTISGLLYFANAFHNGKAAGILRCDPTSELNPSNVIGVNMIGVQNETYEKQLYKNLGRATVVGRDQTCRKILYGKRYCLNFEYDETKSANITNNQLLYFDHPMKLSQISSVSFSVDTDSPCVRISLFVGNSTDEKKYLVHWHYIDGEDSNNDLAHLIHEIRVADIDSQYDNLGIEILYYTKDDKVGKNVTYCYVSNLEITVNS